MAEEGCGLAQVNDSVERRGHLSTHAADCPALSELRHLPVRGALDFGYAALLERQVGAVLNVHE